MSEIIEGLHFVQTCGACPEQYDVFKDDQQVGYVRLRHGALYADAPTCGGDTVYEAYPDGDGCFNSESERMYHLTRIAKILKGESGDPCPNCRGTGLL